MFHVSIYRLELYPIGFIDKFKKNTKILFKFTLQTIDFFSMKTLIRVIAEWIWKLNIKTIKKF